MAKTNRTHWIDGNEVVVSSWEGRKADYWSVHLNGWEIWKAPTLKDAFRIIRKLASENHAYYTPGYKWSTKQGKVFSINKN